MAQPRHSKLSSSGRRELLADVANLRDGGAATRWLWRKHRGIEPESLHDVMELRDELRRVWLDPIRGNQILDKWLVWRPSPEALDLSYALRGLRSPGKGAAISFSENQLSNLRTYLSQSKSDHLAGFMAFSCSIQTRTLVPNNDKLRSNLIQGVFEHWHRFRFCTNPECLAQYFIAKRRDQTVCDAGICKAEKQREHARKWWNENRAKRVETKAPKGRLKHGPGKTR